FREASASFARELPSTSWFFHIGFHVCATLQLSIALSKATPHLAQAATYDPVTRPVNRNLSPITALVYSGYSLISSLNLRSTSPPRCANKCRVFSAFTKSSIGSKASSIAPLKACL